MIVLADAFPRKKPLGLSFIRPFLCLISGREPYHLGWTAGAERKTLVKLLNKWDSVGTSKLAKLTQHRTHGCHRCNTTRAKGWIDTFWFKLPIVSFIVLLDPSNKNNMMLSTKTLFFTLLLAAVATISASDWEFRDLMEMEDGNHTSHDEEEEELEGCRCITDDSIECSEPEDLDECHCMAGWVHCGHDHGHHEHGDSHDMETMEAGSGASSLAVGSAIAGAIVAAAL